MSRLPTTREETPFFVHAGGEDIFGVLTAPTVEPRGIAALVLTGGAFVGATNRNRVSVRIARDLAAMGFHAVRMDYHGVGDSTGDIDTYPLDRPFVEDILPAVLLMQERGVDRCVFVGTTCFGARTALSTAAKVPNVSGVVLLAAPIRDYPNSVNPDATPTQHYVRRALSPRTLATLRDPAKRRQYATTARWKAGSAAGRLRSRLRSGEPALVADGMSSTFYGPLAELAERRVPVLIGYGLEDRFYSEFLEARAKPRLGRLLDAPGSRIELRTVEGSIHALRRISAQDAMVALTTDWLAEIHEGVSRAA
jgi:pimeloyl-ACP methyl ester carboxylesterase